MKYLVLSDIHGSLPRLEQVMKFFDDDVVRMCSLNGSIVQEISIACRE